MIMKSRAAGDGAAGFLSVSFWAPDADQREALRGPVGILVFHLRTVLVLGFVLLFPLTGWLNRILDLKLYVSLVGRGTDQRKAGAKPILLVHAVRFGCAAAGSDDGAPTVLERGVGFSHPRCPGI